MSTGPNVPDLTIPINFDYTKALADLQKLKQELDQFNASAQSQLKTTADATKPVEEGFSGIGKAMSGISLAAIGSAAMSELDRMTQYIQKATQAFLEFNKAQQQIAGLTDNRNNISFNLDQAKQAAQAGLKPQEWNAFQTTLQSAAGPFLSGKTSRMANMGESIAFQQQLALLSNAMGMAPADAAKLAGSVLGDSQGNLTAKGAMAALGRQFNVLNAAQTDPAKLLPGMAKLTASGVSGDEAAQLLGLFSETAPSEEATYAQNTLQKLSELLLKGKGGELGINEQMTPLTRLRTAAETLSARSANGESVDKLLFDLGFRDIALRGMRGAVTKGVQGGGFDRQADYLNDTSTDFVGSKIKEYQNDPNGQIAASEAWDAYGQMRLGSRHVNAERLRKEARGDLSMANAFGQFSWANVGQDLLSETVGSNSYFKALNITGAVSAEDRMINARAIALARRQSGQEYAWYNPVGWGVSAMDTAASMSGSWSQSRLDSLAPPGPDSGSMSDSLVKLLQSSERSAKANEATAEAVKAQNTRPRTLSAPPPQPATRTP